MPDFLDLPAELRLNIYEHLIPIDKEIRLFLVEPEHLRSCLLDLFAIHHTANPPMQILRLQDPITESQVCEYEATKIVNFCNMYMSGDTQRNSAAALLHHHGHQFQYFKPSDAAIASHRRILHATSKPLSLV